MLGDRLLATLYDGSPLPGPVRLEAGSYDLKIRNLLWPALEVYSATVSPTALPCPAPTGTFCVVQDWHSDRVPVAPDYTTPSIHGLYNNYLEFSSAAARDQEALQGLQRLQPAFLLCNGDNIHWGTPEIIPTFATLTSGLPFPRYATLGHHETKVLDGARAALKSSWGAALPGADTWYAFSSAGVLFVCVDSAYFQDPANGSMQPYAPPDWAGQVGCTVPVRQWLAAMLAANASGDRLPVVVVTHHTLTYRQPLPPPLAAYATQPPCDADEMLALVQTDPYVRAVVSGHGHFQQAVTVGAVTHLQGAALGEGPMTFLRGLVFGDHLEFETYQPVSTTHLLQSALPTGTWAVGYPGDLNVTIAF
jgi:hypothetical protein